MVRITEEPGANIIYKRKRNAVRVPHTVNRNCPASDSMRSDDGDDGVESSFVWDDSDLSHQDVFIVEQASDDCCDHLWCFFVVDRVWVCERM